MAHELSHMAASVVGLVRLVARSPRLAQTDFSHPFHLECEPQQVAAREEWKGNLAKLEEVVRQLKAEHFQSQINERLQSWTGRLRFVHVMSTEDFTLGIFALRRGAAIPLHNHPGMTVFFKVLEGSLEYRSFDWEDHTGCPDCTLVGNGAGGPGVGGCWEREWVEERVEGFASLSEAARLDVDSDCRVIRPCTGGNMHTVRSDSDLAIFLDVTVPPYTDEEEEEEGLDEGSNGGKRWVRRQARGCSYFQESERGGRPYLTRIPPPEDYVTD